MSRLMIVVSEYSDLNKRSRRLDLLLKMKKLCESDGWECDFVHINISPFPSLQRTTFSCEDGVKRCLIVLRKPALLFAIIMGLKASIKFAREVVSKGRTFIVLIGTEYIPSLYLLVIYVILRFMLGISKSYRLIFVYDYVDLYLQTYNYKNIEKAVYSIVEVAFLKIARIILVSSYVIKKYVEKRVKKNKKVVYFPPSVPVSEIANICKTVNRSEIRRKLGFFDDDIIVTYVGNVEKEISGIDILTEALLKIETSNSCICERIRTVLILAISDTAENSLNMINRILQQMTRCKDSVRIFTNVERKKVFEVLCASDFGLALLDPNTSTSKQVDWPLKVAEYVGSGLPIIYTPFGNIRSLLIDNIHGFEVSRNPNDILRVYSKIYRLRSNDLAKLKNAVVSLREYVNIDSYSNTIFHTLLDEIRHSWVDIK
ncbi:MAG: glycosyltransferase [Desulfurococcaceae archaeon]